MAAVIQNMDTWPVHTAEHVAPPVATGQQGPRRPAVPIVVCGGPGAAEIEWSTFQRRAQGAANNFLAQRAWVGEWQCRARVCEGGHVADAEIGGVPALWTREPPPHSALPMCSCQALRLVPVLRHDPNAVQDPWSGTWTCMRCGIWDSVALGASRGAPVGGVALQLAAERLSVDHWHEASGRGADFWTTVRDRAAESVRRSQEGRPLQAAGPPDALVAATDSRVYVPLLFDAAGLLSGEAQQAWRSHDLSASRWHQWVEQLRAAAPVQMQALATALQELLRARPHAPALNKDVCLVWEAAARRSEGCVASLADVVQNSRTDLGYCPSLAQEVLLGAFGGHELTQGVLELADALRARSAQRASAGAGGEAAAATVSEGTTAAASGAPAASRIGPFVQASDLVTGFGWNRTIAAAAEVSDMPRAPAGARAAASEQQHLQQGAGMQPVSTTEDDPGASGLTQGVENMDVEDPTRREGDGADNYEQGERRVRRRRQGQESCELLRCAMCQSADAHQAADSRGLMQHLVRAHMGQALLPEAISQLRQLGKEACRVCASIRARTNPYCAHCGCATATRPLQQGDVVPDRRCGPAAVPDSQPPPATTPPSAASPASVAGI